jgi:hypothetical protein
LDFLYQHKIKHTQNQSLMRKFFTLFFVLFLAAYTQAETVTKTYNVTNLTVTTKDGFQTINFDDMVLGGPIGEPALPYYAVKLMLPPGHEAVSISFHGEDLTSVQGYHKLYPMQPSRPLSQRESNSPFSINSAVYSSADTYPQSQTGRLSTHFMNGYAYALATFTPLQYVPESGEIKWFQTVTIVIETRESERAIQALANLPMNEETAARCRAYAQNTEMSDNYGNSQRSANSYDVLIITPQTFETNMEGLKNLYMNQGMKVNVSTTEFIASNSTGIDMPEKIRNHIISEYQNNGISQVILGGDVELVAYRGFYCHVQSSSVYEDDGIPADLYYSALDGNWNTNGNSKWGEIGEDDLLPDISVGRISFSNIAELSAIINKTLKYQTQPVEGELNDHLLAGENLYYGPDTWGSDYLELLIGYRTDNGYTTNGIPESYPILKMYDELGDWSPQDLINTINTGRSFISHVGHANENYTMKLYNSDITNSNFYGVNGVDHNFPLVYTHGCICGSYDANDCIGERMICIDNFASVFVGNSRYGWFNEGQTEGPSAHLHREFMDALFTDSLQRVGSAHMESKIATAPWVNAPGQWEEGALRWCFYDCNVLGDPAMAIWANEPRDISTTYPASIALEAGSFYVVVTEEGLPAKNLTVAAIKDNVLVGRGITDNEGIAEVVFDVAIGETGPLQIIVSGYNCKPTSYTTQIASNVGITDQETARIQVVPNPASEQIQVTLDENLTAGTFILTDLSGRIVKEFKFQPQRSVTIPLTGIEKGVYLLQMPGSKSKALTKIIVQ